MIKLAVLREHHSAENPVSSHQGHYAPKALPQTAKVPKYNAFFYRCQEHYPDYLQRKMIMWFRASREQQ